MNLELITNSSVSKSILLCSVVSAEGYGCLSKSTHERNWKKYLLFFYLSPTPFFGNMIQTKPSSKLEAFHINIVTCTRPLVPWKTA